MACAHVFVCSSKVGWGLRSGSRAVPLQAGWPRLMKELARRDEQPICLPREFLSRPGVANRRQPSPA